ncbi:MAG TPA: hypothetical protein VE175_04570 [Woeseiaceae bacterium]|nr:hypothetical protein [Woeseiaceae bacterium]
MLTCREFDGFIVDYLARELPLTRQLSCWLHVSMCGACRKYLRQYRKTMALGKQAFEAPGDAVPETVPDELVKAALIHRRAMRSTDRND